jgi:hypothetical protein
MKVLALLSLLAPAAYAQSVPVVLQVSPLHGGPVAEAQSQAFRFNLDPDCVQDGDVVGQMEAESALAGLAPGNYEIVVIRPGAANVQTWLVCGQGTLQSGRCHMVLTSDMELSGGEFMDGAALSDTWGGSQDKSL